MYVQYKKEMIEIEHFTIQEYDKSNITEDIKEQVYRLLQFSEYDFSTYIGTDLNSRGEFEYEHFADYFTDPDRKIYLLRVRDHPAGFAFINHVAYHCKEKEVLCVAEFFIMKKYRRKGYGNMLAKTIFDAQKGKWGVFQMKSNVAAGLFWEKVIADYTKNNYAVFDAANDDGHAGRAFVFTS